MYLFRMSRTLLVALALHALGTVWSQAYFVQALPYLNLLDKLNPQTVVAELGYGTPVEVVQATGRRDTLDGLPGQRVVVHWEELGQTGQVFDAYLWPCDVPRGFESPSDGIESFDDYCTRVVDGMTALIYGTKTEDYGGPYSETSYLDVDATQGQAVHMLRIWIQALHGEDLINGQLAMHDAERWPAIMGALWRPETDPSWWMGFSSEGGGSTWSLEISPNFSRPSAHPVFRLTYGFGSC